MNEMDNKWRQTARRPANIHLLHLYLLNQEEYPQWLDLLFPFIFKCKAPNTKIKTPILDS
jgi:hypothetical protein